jgi:nitroimidazol reductase NimA-like FMN-containing flavoprotein (pyridoxamine 5'-phosphate oxidase superfamily)
MSNDEKRIEDYIKKTGYAILATVERGGPVQRTIGAFGNVGSTLYFATRSDSRKVDHIAAESRVSVLLQHERQDLATFVNVAVEGRAVRLTSEAEVAAAIEIIGEHSERFRERVRGQGISGQAIFRVDAEEIRVLDFARGVGQAAISVLRPQAA